MSGLEISTSGISSSFIPNKKYKNDPDAKDSVWFWFGVFSVIVLVFIVAIAATMDTTLAMFNNPEYIALRDVLSMIGQ